MKDQLKSTTSITSQEPSDAKATTTMQLISETPTPMATVSTHTGTNSSDLMANTSTTNKAKSCVLTATRMKKESMLEVMLRRTKLHTSGESSTPMERMPQEPRVLTLTEVSISTDLSSFNLDCGWKESSVLLEVITL